MTRIILLIVSVGFLGGCAATFHEDINAGIAQFQGQHIENAVQKLGIPSNVVDIAGKKTYIWKTSRARSFSVSDTEFDFQSRKWVKTKSQKTVTAHCKFYIQVNGDEIIVNGRWEDGNRRGCNVYVKKLAR